MKKMIFALCLLGLTVSMVAAYNPQPDSQTYGYFNGTYVNSGHVVRFNGAVSSCSTPAHKGLLAGHNHGWMTMHNILNTQICQSYTVTSGNWISVSGNTIWQLKRSHCGCEGWLQPSIPPTCPYVQGNIRAYCYFN